MSRNGRAVPLRPRYKRRTNLHENLYRRIRLQSILGAGWRACLTPLQARCVFRGDSGSRSINLPPSAMKRWRAVAHVLRSTLDALVCVLFPASCELCDTPLSRFSLVPICACCWKDLEPLGASGCVRCGDLLDLSDQPLCRACRMAPPPFERAVSWGVYRNNLRALIHAFKYRGMKWAGGRLGVLLAQACATLADEMPGEVLVVPVPLHRSRLAARGYNQARLLARHAVRRLHHTHPAWHLRLAPHALFRTRATESQTGLTNRQRRLNLRGAFAVQNREAVRGRAILLVDDVMTTGATVRAAAGELKRAGAAGVWVATLARAQREAANTSASFAGAPSSQSFIPMPAAMTKPAGIFIAGQPSSSRG